MGQQDVKKVLKKEGTWLISNEIAKKAGYSLKSIQSSLRRLVKWGHVEKKPASKVISEEKRLKDRSFAGFAYKLKEYKTISDQKFDDKKVLLLTDLISIKTIKELYLANNIKLAILPHTEKNIQTYVDVLSSKLNKKITFISDIFSKETENKLKNIKPGQIILFDNISNLKEERKENSPKKQSKSKLVKTLVPHFEYFINDAFSISHKAYASSVGFSYSLPSFIGRNFQKNLETLQNFKNLKSSITFVLGGTKSLDLIKLMEVNNKKQHKFLLTGPFSHLALKEIGTKLGNPEKTLKQFNLKSNKNFKNFLKNSTNISLPKDLALSTLGNRDEITLKDFPVYQNIHDLGKETIKDYESLILKSKVVFFKGLPGNYREENFHTGTETLLSALARTKAEVYLVGKETMGALKYFNIAPEKFKFVSKNSDPVITYLTQGTLPVLEALKEKI
ncbi:MAG: phosphoglycerate kinase [Nanoarchaeota archaeon]|nr:phosphoglycerate kinase [Nanoarchaeota archaeon]